MLSIDVNRTPVRSDVPPLVVAGHVLLPARAVFEALGAAIDYDARTRQIDVRRGKRFVRVTLDSRNARIGDKTVRLDVAPQIYRGRTMLPLRFVAESLGATVSYRAATHAVRIADAEAPLTLQPARPAAYGPPSVENRHPAPGEYVTGPFPSIYASLETHGGPAIDPATVRVFIDGRDVSDEIYRAGDDVAFTPRHELFAGAHEVTVQGADTGGTRFTANWSFQSTFVLALEPPQVLGFQAPTLSLLGPSAFGFGSTAQFMVLGPPGGYGYVSLCGYGPQYAFGTQGDPTRYYSVVNIPTGLYAPACYVSGYFYQSNGFANYFSLPLPLRIDSRLPAATPTPAPPRQRRPLAGPSPVRPGPSASPSPRQSAPAPHTSPAQHAAPARTLPPHPFVRPFTPPPRPKGTPS
jgi:hypothetical protein